MHAAKRAAAFLELHAGVWGFRGGYCILHLFLLPLGTAQADLQAREAQAQRPAACSPLYLQERAITGAHPIQPLHLLVRHQFLSSERCLIVIFYELTQACNAGQLSGCRPVGTTHCG